MQQDLFQKKGDRLGLQTKIPFDMLHIDCARNAEAQLVERQTGDLRVVCSSLTAGGVTVFFSCI